VFVFAVSPFGWLCTSLPKELKFTEQEKKQPRGRALKLWQSACAGRALGEEHVVCLHLFESLCFAYQMYDDTPRGGTEQLHDDE
jgi:dimeric dUTPase (all-alpha-NTP-PPase superfamily)